MIVSLHARAGDQLVAEGLAVEMVEGLDLTYQILPSYDENEKVLMGWNGDKAQYFVGFMKLPPGWLDANVWIAGFKRDITAASERDTFKVLNQGTAKSRGGFSYSFVDVTFVQKGGTQLQKMQVHFIANNKHSYVATATAVTDAGEAKMRGEVKQIIATAYAVRADASLPATRTEDRYVGVWQGTTTDAKNRTVTITFQLKADLTFARKETVEGEKDAVFTGAWFVSANQLVWTYLYGKPTTLDAKAPEETDNITSVSEEELVLVSAQSGKTLTLARAQ
ncbi:MAG TPA: hypothetical protein VM553_00160 [Dongiaceae bacterium]|nr:hypothetical protein [Dongiaceae bacterium]